MASTKPNLFFELLQCGLLLSLLSAHLAAGELDLPPINVFRQYFFFHSIFSGVIIAFLSLFILCAFFFFFFSFLLLNFLAFGIFFSFQEPKLNVSNAIGCRYMFLLRPTFYWQPFLAYSLLQYLVCFASYSIKIRFHILTMESLLFFAHNNESITGVFVEIWGAFFYFLSSVLSVWSIVAY